MQLILSAYKRAPKRSKFQLHVIIIELCKNPGGVSLTRLVRFSRINWGPLKEILSTLITGELLKVETRHHSETGQKRETQFYIRTNKGESVLREFKDLKKRITMSGSRSE